MQYLILTAAGGNHTALVYDHGLNRGQYAQVNDALMQKHPELEQVGFLESSENGFHLQMAGGEFCGNASTMFATLLRFLNPAQAHFAYTVSGFPNPVSTTVSPSGQSAFDCIARFPGFDYQTTEAEVDGNLVTIVDLGGIIHIVTKSPFNKQGYEAQLHTVKSKLGVDHDAVGVIWAQEQGDEVRIEPVVWVRAINTCFYESACGSGSIAATITTGKQRVIQPSGEAIMVSTDGNDLILSSQIAILNQLTHEGS